jgi:hypothetical protein
VKTVDEIMREGGPGQIAGVGNVSMGQPQVINLSGAGLSGDLNEQIQQAMQIAQQAMQQAQEGTPPTELTVSAATPGSAPTTETPSAAAPDAPSSNMVEERLAALERLAKLRDSGVLSDAEFEAEKIKVLRGG